MVSSDYSRHVSCFFFFFGGGAPPPLAVCVCVSVHTPVFNSVSLPQRISHLPSPTAAQLAWGSVQGSGPLPELLSGVHAKRKNPARSFSYRGWGGVGATQPLMTISSGPLLNLQTHLRRCPPTYRPHQTHFSPPTHFPPQTHLHPQRISLSQPICRPKPISLPKQSPS